MKAIDICYTPLDLPEPPEYSVDEVKQWIIENTDELQECVKDLCSRGMAAQDIGYKYPWRLVFAYWDEYGGWLNDFDKKFPELSKYMHEVYNISENELTSIILLPLAIPSNMPMATARVVSVEEPPAGVRICE